MTTNCSDNAQSLGRLVAPLWDDTNMLKNRVILEKNTERFQDMNVGTIVHIYFTRGSDPHEAIIVKIKGWYLVYDSYKDHRTSSARMYPTITFDKLFHEFGNGSIIAYMKLFRPPALPELNNVCEVPIVTLRYLYI